jgi:ribosome-binding protein aMBF1 (putative translation factor)
MSEWDELRATLLNSNPETQRIYDQLEPRMRVIRRVITARAERGWSQRQLAEAAGMTQPQVARFESGDTDPRLSTVQRLYAALDIDSPPLHSTAA